MDGTRCDMPAGHPGDHCVERTWGDDECLDPSTLTRGQRTAPQESAVTLDMDYTPAPAEPAPSRCIACQHQHKGGTCKCGCYEYIG